MKVSQARKAIYMVFAILLMPYLWYFGQWYSVIHAAPSDTIFFIEEASFRDFLIAPAFYNAIGLFCIAFFMFYQRRKVDVAMGLLSLFLASIFFGLMCRLLTVW